MIVMMGGYMYPEQSCARAFPCLSRSLQMLWLLVIMDAKLLVGSWCALVQRSAAHQHQRCMVADKNELHVKERIGCMCYLICVL
jgi:hypothetical protein